MVVEKNIFICCICFTIALWDDLQLLFVLLLEAYRLKNKKWCAETAPISMSEIYDIKSILLRLKWYLFVEVCKWSRSKYFLWIWTARK